MTAGGVKSHTRLGLPPTAGKQKMFDSEAKKPPEIDLWPDREGERALPRQRKRLSHSADSTPVASEASIGVKNQTAKPHDCPLEASLILKRKLPSSGTESEDGDDDIEDTQPARKRSKVQNRQRNTNRKPEKPRETSPPPKNPYIQYRSGGEHHDGMKAQRRDLTDQVKRERRSWATVTRKAAVLRLDVQYAIMENLAHLHFEPGDRDLSSPTKVKTPCSPFSFMLMAWCVWTGVDAYSTALWDRFPKYGKHILVKLHKDVRKDMLEALGSETSWESRTAAQAAEKQARMQDAGIQTVEEHPRTHSRSAADDEMLEAKLGVVSTLDLELQIVQAEQGGMRDLLIGLREAQKMGSTRPAAFGKRQLAITKAEAEAQRLSAILVDGARRKRKLEEVEDLERKARPTKKLRAKLAEDEDVQGPSKSVSNAVEA